MKTLNLESFNAEEMTLQELATINGGGAAGPSAGYWTSGVDDATCQKVGKTVWDVFWWAVDMAL